MNFKLSYLITIILIIAGSMFAVVPLENDGIVVIQNIRPKPGPAELMSADEIPGSELLNGNYFARLDPITGKVQLLTGTGIAISGYVQVNEANAGSAAVAFVEEYSSLIGVHGDAIRVESVEWLKDRAYVHLRQYDGDVPFWAGDLNLMIHPDSKVSLMRNDLVPDLGALPPNVISEEMAVDIAVDYVKPTSEPRRIDRLGNFAYPIWQDDSYTIHRAWVIRVMSSEPFGLFEIAVDASNGTVLSATNEVRTAELSGSLTGMFHPEFKDDPLEIGIWPYAHITIGTYSFTTDQSGNWAEYIMTSAPWSYSTEHYGTYCNVNNGAGSDASYSTSFTSSIYSFGWSASTSPVNEMNLYYHTNKVHAHVRDTLLYSGMNYRMPCRVNDPSMADNAYFDGTGINFGAGATVFYDLSLFNDIIYHEYTHGVTHKIYPYGALPYTGQSGAIDEGLADYYPCSMNEDPYIGNGGLYRGGTEYMRRCNSSLRYPTNWVDEVHADGQIISGAWWKIRTELGRSYTDSLLHLSRFLFPEDFEEFFWATLATDDDDSDILNGTPNARLIYDSYDAHGIGPGYNLIVDHTPLPNTEITTGNYLIRADFIATLGIQEDSARVYYRLDGGAWTSFDLDLVFGTYRANIPAQPYGTTIDYYIYCYDNGGYPICSPTDAPSSWHTFHVIQDTTPPTVLATPVGRWFEYAWPPSMTATVTDEHGIASVEIHGRIDDLLLPPSTMAETDTPGLWRGGLPGTPAGNDTVRYWIEATDVALSPHTTVFPPTGDFFTVVLPGYNEDMEIDNRGLSKKAIRAGYTNNWSRIPLNNPYTTGSTCYAFTNAASGEYSDQGSGALSTPELRIGETATLTFWHRMKAEDHSSYATFAWDGGIVEVSTDGGSSWFQVEPSPGYNKRIYDNPASPFEANTDCYSGDIPWRQESLDLSPYAPRAMVRFQFGSDAHVTDEGWFIDDIVLETVFPNVGERTHKPELIAIDNVRPNPFNSAAVIELSLPSGTAAELRIFDVSGRMVREFTIDDSRNSVVWNGRDNTGADLSSGVYFARLVSGSKSDVAKMILLK